MQISEAKQIPLKDIIERLGGKYAHTKHNDEWYYSPFRPNERTPSFKVNLKTNTWVDFGHSDKGGSIIDLWCDYHSLDRKTAVSQALQGIAALYNSPGECKPPIAPSRPEFEKPLKVERYTIGKLYPKISHPRLLAELGRRKITPATAAPYLKQVFIRDNDFPDRKLIGFAFANEKNGWEISIPNPAACKNFKTSIGGKEFSLSLARIIRRLSSLKAFGIF